MSAYSREAWARALMVLVPLPIIWVINWALLRVFDWPLLLVVVVFAVLWFALGRLALLLSSQSGLASATEESRNLVLRNPTRNPQIPRIAGKTGVWRPTTRTA